MSAEPLRVSPAVTSDDYATFGELVREYVDALGFPLTFQDIERELAELAHEYGPPDGGAWIAFAEDSPAGIVGLRRFDHDAAEIKRMFVRPPFRGLGLGRLLAATAVGGARALNYRRVLLDSVRSMTGAIAIYRSLGFEEIPAYRHNPRPDAVFMAIDLARN